MNKAETARLAMAIRRGELNETWVTLQDGRMFFANVVSMEFAQGNQAALAVTFYTEHEIIQGTVDQIFKAVH